MKRTFQFHSVMNAVGLAAAILAGAGRVAAGADSTNPAPVEFHVKPDGIQPFHPANSEARPALGKPGKPIWNTSGIEPAYWLSDAGSVRRPFATLYQAQLAVRELLRQKGMPAGGVKVVVHGGTYRLTEPLIFVPGDSGTAERPVVFEAAAGEKPSISGGVPVNGWTKSDKEIPGLPVAAKGNVWSAPVPEIGAIPLDFRQLYVNGVKAERARTPNAESYLRLSHWDVANRQVLVDARDVAQWRNLKRVELVLQESWVVSFLRLDSISIEGDQARITFQNPERDLVFSHPFPWARHTDPFHFVNALEFLDAPGEWYLDNKAGVVYYWPRTGEDLTTAEVIAPRLETLVCVKGSSERPVHDIQFKGLTFSDSTWMRPTLAGHVPLQAGQYLEQPGYRIQGGIPEAPKLENQAWAGRPPAAVHLAGASRIGFERCVFRNTASAALDFHHTTRSNEVVGCAFVGVGGNGVQVGKFSEDGLEAHVPYTVSDDRELSLNDRIVNCYFRDCGIEDWGCVGIAGGYPRGLVIEHNELVDLPYSAISIGWGWTKLPTAMRDNKVRFNRIHRYMKRLGDGGGVYLLSSQPGSELYGNYVYDLRRSPVGDAGHMIYLDEGSSGILVKDNRIETNSIYLNANGSGNRVENSSPDATFDLATMPGANGVIGIEPQFREPLKEEIAEEDWIPADPFNRSK